MKKEESGFVQKSDFIFGGKQQQQKAEAQWIAVIVSITSATTTTTKQATIWFTSVFFRVDQLVPVHA